MANIHCEQCDSDFQAFQLRVPQITSCPHCKTAVTIPALMMTDCNDSALDNPNSITTDKPAKFPIKWIIIGFAVPIVYVLLYYSITISQYIQSRPWLKAPISFSLLGMDLVLVFAIPYLAFRSQGISISIKSIALTKVIKEFLIALLVFIGIVIVIGVCAFLIELILPAQDDLPDRLQWTAFGMGNISAIAFMFFAVILAPIAEEFYFRRFLYRALKSRMNWILAILIQAAFFAITHQYGLRDTFGVFIIGIILALIYDKRKTLITPIFTHAMINAIAFTPFIILSIINFHLPAKNNEQAQTNPQWLNSISIEEMERQDDGELQRQYIIDTYGSKGKRLWKKEIAAFEKLIEWFPDDRAACANARGGIAYVYTLYLKDYHRAIVHADRVLSEYPEQEDICARALLNKGLSHYMLKELEQAKAAFIRIIENHPKCEYECSEARHRLFNLSWIVPSGVDMKYITYSRPIDPNTLNWNIEITTD